MLVFPHWHLNASVHCLLPLQSEEIIKAGLEPEHYFSLISEF